MSLILALLLGSLGQSPNGRLGWVPNPRTTSGSWVADPARHLRPATVRALDSLISQLERETSTEIAVVVIDSLDGLDAAEAALLLHRRWGVGKAARDNGLLFLWSPALRRTQVSVGRGLEGVLIDSRVGRILDRSVLPAFRRNDFDAGMLAGVRALAAAAREETFSGPARSQALSPGRDATSPARDNGAGRGDGAIAGAFGGLLVLIGGAIAGVRWRRRRPRKCPRGHGSMHRIDDASDERFLDAGQGVEEQLRSIDYDVWICDMCDERLVIPYRKWFTRYEDCPKCKRRTCESKLRTVSSATTTSTGLRKVTRRCKNCGFTDTRTEVIPMVSESSGSSGGGSSGGGGGSSFGGGSSSGGGAGRSY